MIVCIHRHCLAPVSAINITINGNLVFVDGNGRLHNHRKYEWIQINLFIKKIFTIADDFGKEVNDTIEETVFCLNVFL